MMIAFLILSAVIVISALGVVVLENPIYSALSLITNLFFVAGMFALLDAHFLAVAQIIVYAGAIMVLFLFTIMLLNLKNEQPKRRSLIYQVLAWGAGIGFAGILARVFIYSFRRDSVPASGTQLEPPVQGTTKAIGEVLYTQYVFTFEAASLLIIVAVLGAVMLAKRRYRGMEPIGPAKEA